MCPQYPCRRNLSADYGGRPTMGNIRLALYNGTAAATEARPFAAALVCALAKIPVIGARNRHYVCY